MKPAARVIREPANLPDTNTVIMLMWRNQIAQHQGILRPRKVKAGK